MEPKPLEADDVSWQEGVCYTLFILWGCFWAGWVLPMSMALAFTWNTRVSWPVRIAAAGACLVGAGILVLLGYTIPQRIRRRRAKAAQTAKGEPPPS